jgi:hypothetical protein
MLAAAMVQIHPTERYDFMAAAKGSVVTVVLRVVLLAALAGVCAVFFLDRKAGGECDAARKNVAAAIDKDKTGKGDELVGPDKIHTLLGRNPDSAAEKAGSVTTEVYTYPSPVRKYRLVVKYVSLGPNLRAEEANLEIP